MASITREANGRRTIQFVGADGKRRSIRLGKVSQRTAEAFKIKVEALNTATITGQTVDDETARWVIERDQPMSDKLAAVGLIPRRASATLGAFLTIYIGDRTDIKPGTKKIWHGVHRNLLDHFGADRPMRSISVGDAEQFARYLGGLGVASTTQARVVQQAKQFFQAAVKHRLIPSNPFADVKVKAVMLPGRQRFITPDEVARLLDAAPSADWRAIIGLSRWGGLRCPSEVLSIRWQDVDWEHGRMLVTSPKTAHHPGKGTRTIPLFPELRPILEEAFETAPVGAVYVVSERFRDYFEKTYVWSGHNLHTVFGAIIRRAGLEPWPRPFHNLRSSRETELAERFPLHVVTAWLGNTPEIARKHYLQVTDDHFAQALNAAVEAVQNPVQQPAETARNTLHGDPKNAVFAGVCDVLPGGSPQLTM